jgi:hypothetical protein
VRAETAPLTFGQLSVWRDVDQLPAGQRHAGNLLRTAPVGAGVSVADLLGAFRGLRARHEALRTTYDFSDAASPRQIVSPPGTGDVPVRCVTVDAGMDFEAAAAEIGKDMELQALDLSTEESWRIAILIADGRPVHLAVVLHHIAVDIWALNLLDKDFRALLSGDRLGLSPAPSQLAIAQHSPQWRSRRESAQEHQRAALTAVARAGGPPVPESPAQAVRASLTSRVALAEASALASSLRISVPSLVLAAYCFAAHQVSGSSDILVKAMCANRVYPGTSALLTSMNQWGLCASQANAGEPFGTFAQRAHWASVRAQRHSCYDPDAAAVIRGEVAATVGAIGPEFSFNYVHTEPADAPPAQSEPIGPLWSVHHEPPRNTAGPAFFLVATQGASLSLGSRVMWDGFDATALETFLLTVHALMTGRLLHIGQDLPDPNP